MRRSLVGLDIDLCSVKMIQLRRDNDGYTVVGVAMTDVAPGGDDRALYRSNVVEAIRRCSAALGPGKKLAVCGLRGPDVIVRGFEFPALTAEETRGAVELEVSRMCLFGKGDGVLDHQVTSSEGGRTRGFWVAANRDLAEDKRQLVRHAGLQCVLMDVDGLALLNCLANWRGRTRAERLEHDDPDGTESILLDVGDSHASIAMNDHLHQPFVRDLSCGGHEITWQVARDMQMPLDEARAVLMGEVEGDVGLLHQGLERACERLLEDIVTTLRYYAAQNRGVRVRRMLVCGGLTLAKGFIDLLAHNLSMDVVPWNPVDDMPCDIDPSSKAMLGRVGPAMAVAAGLAMRTT